MQHTILYFPDYVHANPDQSLLYSGIDAVFHSQSGSIEDARLKLQRQARDSRVVFHLHWEDAIYRHLPGEVEALAECQRFLDQLEGFQDDGGLFLWTVHNLAPHDGRYLDVHREFSAKLTSLADQIHLHSYAALEELEQQRALDRGKVTVVPHCNYGPLFPNPGPLETKRGRGRPALPAVRAARPLQGWSGSWSRALPGSTIRRPGLRSPASRSTRSILPGAGGGPRPDRVRHRYLSDAELRGLFGEADFVVSPYRASLTSGTVLLAMSLARPVIVPRLPTLAELVVDGDNGLLSRPAIRPPSAPRSSAPAGSTTTPGGGWPGGPLRPPTATTGG